MTRQMREPSQPCQLHRRTYCGQCFGVDVHSRVHSGSPTCPHDGQSHETCPHSAPCLGDCGKRTTAYESCAPGYCPSCAGCVPADPNHPPGSVTNPVDVALREVERTATTVAFAPDELAERLRANHLLPPPSLQLVRGRDKEPTDEELRQQLVDTVRNARDRAREAKKKWPLTPAGEVDAHRAMSALGRRFGLLTEKLPGISPWDATALLRSVVLGGFSHSEILAAKFLLGLWNSSYWAESANADEQLLAQYRRAVEDPKAQIVFSSFNIFEAMSVWDYPYRDAMLYWLAAPFWP